MPFKNSSHDFNEKFVLLGFGTSYNSVFNSSSNFSSNSCSGTGSKFFIAKNLLLKVLINFFLAVTNNSVFLRNNFFSMEFIPLSILFNLLGNLLWSSSLSFDEKYPSRWWWMQPNWFVESNQGKLGNWISKFEFYNHTKINTVAFIFCGKGFCFLCLAHSCFASVYTLKHFWSRYFAAYRFEFNSICPRVFLSDHAPGAHSSPLRKSW